MNSSKVKNIIIILLLAVNIALGGAAFADWSHSRAMYASEMDGVSEVLAANGISLTEAAASARENLSKRSVMRDLAAEQRRIASVLGQVTVAEQGGNIYLYTGKNGQAVCRGTGGFELLINEGVFQTGRDAEDTARDFAKKLGISVKKGEGSVENNVAGGSGAVVLKCTSDGTDIVNCQLSFNFANGSLFFVSGTRPLDEMSSNETERGGLDLPAVLLRFLEIVKSGGHVCSEVRAAEMCYIQTASASGTGELVPVWRIVTDSGDFYINSLTGRQETVS